MRTSGMLTGLILGAGAMYFLDPQQGRRRRAMWQNQLERMGHSLPDALDVAWRDLSNRTFGVASEMRHLIEADDASDAVISQRVRSKLGRCVGHPAAIQVDVADGCVCLSGPVLRHEVDGLLSAVRNVRGVCEVEDQLDVHDSPGTFAPLQGTDRRSTEAAQRTRRQWAPATRLIAGSTGALLVTSGACQRSLMSPLYGLAGLALLARSVANQDFARMLGVSGGRRVIDIRKTIEIAAPVERVYAFFADPTNLRRISDVVTKVDLHGGGRFTKHMTIGGMPIRFEERFTRAVPNEFISSRSEPGSVLQYMKEARFERAGDHSRLHMLFSYNPPGGVVAHAVAGVLGFDPKTLLDDLLMRAKSYLETGKMPHDATGKHDTSKPLRGQRHVPATEDVWTSGRQ